MALVLLLSLVGCTRRHNLTELRHVPGELEVTTRDGRSYDAVVTQTREGRAFVAKSGGVLSTGDVTRVVDRRHIQGSLEGLAIGAGAGVVVGAVLGYAIGDGDDDCDSSSCSVSFGPEFTALLAGMYLGAIGGGVGLVVGAVRGSPYIYENKASQVTVTPVGPPGSAAGMTIKW